MGDKKKSLKELWAIVRNYGEPCERISSKPFRPCSLHVIVSTLEPRFYTEQELLQLNNFRNQETTNHDLIKKRSRQDEETPKDEMVKQVGKKSRKMIVSNNVAPPLPHQDFPIAFMNRVTELNGTDVKFLMDKTLFNSDICRNNNRLSMPKNDIMCNFLTKDEKKMLCKRGSNGRLLGVEVTLLDPCLREYTLDLKRWEMNTIVYNLTKDWKNVVADNKLQQGQEFKIWSFRVDKMLYFLLNKV